MFRAPIAATLLLTAIALPTAAGTHAEDSLSAFVRQRYGEEIVFDVRRNGRTVGEHTTRFAIDGDAVRVESRMDLTVRVLLIPVYSFSYVSHEIWRQGDLVHLDARTDDNGEVRHTRAERSSSVLRIENAGRTVESNPDLIPTNHWNPAVLKRTHLLNTITGRVNAIRIERCSEPAPAAMANGVSAQCYDYTGDLSTRVWYDEHGRWVGLKFTGEDGSTIDYVCRQCGRDAT